MKCVVVIEKTEPKNPTYAPNLPDCVIIQI